MQIRTVLHLSGFVMFLFLDETLSFYGKCYEQPIRCYDCDSRIHPNCADPFRSYFVPQIDCQGCCVKRISRIPEYHIVRTCANADNIKIFDFDLNCESRDPYDKKCYCNHDLCNKGNYLSGNNQYFWIIVILSRLLY